MKKDANFARKTVRLFNGRTRRFRASRSSRNMAPNRGRQGGQKGREKRDEVAFVGPGPRVFYEEYVLFHHSVSAEQTNGDMTAQDGQHHPGGDHLLLHLLFERDDLVLEDPIEEMALRTRDRRGCSGRRVIKLSNENRRLKKRLSLTQRPVSATNQSFMIQSFAPGLKSGFSRVSADISKHFFNSFV